MVEFNDSKRKGVKAKWFKYLSTLRKSSASKQLVQFQSHLIQSIHGYGKFQGLMQNSKNIVSLHNDISYRHDHCSLLYIELGEYFSP